MRTVILPYNMTSEGARNLAASLKCLRIRKEASKFNYRDDDVIINWGCSVRPPHIPDHATVINSFDSVALASDKMKAFNRFQEYGVSCPKSTNNPNVAKDWIVDGYCVVARTILNGHGGAGIVMIKELHNFVEAPLYTIYVPKKSEYRVHVLFGKIADVTRKVLREDYPNKENVNWQVRNHDNGFIFVRTNSRIVDDNGEPMYEKDLCPLGVKIEAARAIDALGLNFGAVDVIYNQKRARAFVLEVNTAPGIADTTTEIYTDYIQNHLANVNNKKMFPKKNRNKYPNVDREPRWEVIEDPNGQRRIVERDADPIANKRVRIADMPIFQDGGLVNWKLDLDEEHQVPAPAPEPNF